MVKAKNLQTFWRSPEQFIQTVQGQNNFWFLLSNKLELIECKLEKIIGIQKQAGKVRKYETFTKNLENGMFAISSISRQTFSHKQLLQIKFDFTKIYTA